MINFPLIRDLAPSWRVVDLSEQIGEPAGRGFWSMNPSIHYSTVDDRWRCAARIANYCIPDGIVTAPRGATQSYVAMCEIDPCSWTVEDVELVKDGGSLANLARAPHCASLGLEDLRLFDVGGHGETIFGIACALEFNTRRPGTPEQVLVEIDRASLTISGAMPLRGAWSHRAQKNWAPFDGDVAIRFLYDLEGGVVLRALWQGSRVHEANPQIGQSMYGVPIGAWYRAAPEDLEADLGARSRTKPSDRPGNTYQRGVEVKTMKRPMVTPRAQEVVRLRKPGSDSLRGGSQLVPMESADRWLGVAHEMTMNGADKLYWHTFYTCDRRGRMLERSCPVKLADARIEFAAGLQIVPGQGEIVVSFGVDDHKAKLGIARLAEIERLLEPVEPAQSRARASST